jgi:hypothetical protein
VELHGSDSWVRHRAVFRASPMGAIPQADCCIRPRLVFCCDGKPSLETPCSSNMESFRCDYLSATVSLGNNICKARIPSACLESERCQAHTLLTLVSISCHRIAVLQVWCRLWYVQAVRNQHMSGSSRIIVATQFTQKQSNAGSISVGVPAFEVFSPLCPEVMFASSLLCPLSSPLPPLSSTLRGRNSYRWGLL